MGLDPIYSSEPDLESWTGQTSWALSAIGTQLLRLSPAFVILLFLSSLGLKRKDFYLVKGNIKTIVESSKLLNTKKPARAGGRTEKFDPWNGFREFFGFSRLICVLDRCSPDDDPRF